MNEHDETVQIRFQWMVGDLKGLEKHLKEILRHSAHQVISFSARLTALFLTAGVAYFLLPDASLFIVFLIAIVGSNATWVSWGMEILALKKLERMQADDARRVGWHNVKFDRSGVIWSTDTSQEYISWLGVSEIIADDEGIWMKTGAINGLYLPSRIFESEKQRREIASKIKFFKKHHTLPTHQLDILQTSTDDGIYRPN